VDGVKLIRQGKIKGQKLVFNTADRKLAAVSVPMSEVAMDSESLAATVTV
jgi:hypothetical protein